MTAKTRKRSHVRDTASGYTPRPQETVSQTAREDQPKVLRYAVPALITIAVIYAFLAGFRTVHDYDLGWQLATGRWVVQHHHIPSIDVFSYTARGKPWVYPILSGVLFYGLFSLAGYTALTWLTAMASAATAFLLTRRQGLATATLAIIAVPVLAVRFTARADLFTTVLFAAVLSILWRYHRGGGGALWLLPVLLLLWTNLHWGFVAGLGLCAAYVMLEMGDLLVAERRAAAKKHLRTAWPWLLASGLATLVNPWGPRLYGQVVQWGGALAGSQSAAVTEFAPLRITWSKLAGALAWRDPDLSAIWWLLLIAGVAVLIALFRRNWGSAILIAGAAAAALQRYRFQGMFACVLVVAGGGVLSEAVEAWSARRRNRTAATGTGVRTAAMALCACFALLAGVRAYDLVSNRYYMNNLPFEFGAGLSWWYPERALTFIERERLPGNLFNGWVTGGYLIWRLPQYPDFIDSRGQPFDGEVNATDSELAQQGPDSAAWQEAASKWGISTIIVPVGRIDGYEYFPKLREFCESQSWRPVYMDEVSAVFLRRRPETQALVDRLRIDCKTVRFLPPAVDRSSRNGRADLFNFWTNSAFLFAVLGRAQEALAALDVAQGIFPDSAHLRLQRGDALLRLGRLSEGERELRKSIDLEPDESSWERLSNLLISEQRYEEAAAALRTAAEISLEPAQLYFELGELESKLRHGDAALAAFDKALKFGNGIDSSTRSGAEFYARVHEGRARVWYAMGDLQRAVEAEEQAVHFTPNDGRRWKDLANLYQMLGRTQDAQHAREQIKLSGGDGT